jgi:hypothetical protein
MRACQELGTDHMAGHGVPEACPMPYPYLISHEFEREIARDFGEESDYYRVHILGQFPTAAVNSLVPLEWVEAAFERRVTASGKPYGGLDVARMGHDHTAYVEIAGAMAYRLEEWPKQEVTATEGQVRATVLADDKEKGICIDDTGLGGGVAPHLAEDFRNVVGIDFAGQADDTGRFANKPSEMWWRLRQRLDQSSDDPLALPGQHPLRRRLTAQLSRVTYGQDSRGRIKIDKYGGGHESPDLGDALILALEAQARSAHKWIVA